MIVAFLPALAIFVTLVVYLKILPLIDDIKAENRREAFKDRFHRYPED